MQKHAALLELIHTVIHRSYICSSLQAHRALIWFTRVSNEMQQQKLWLHKHVAFILIHNSLQKSCKGHGSAALQGGRTAAPLNSSSHTINSGSKASHTRQ
eukprot:c3873_g1_i1 orf=19-318(-)